MFRWSAIGRRRLGLVSPIGAIGTENRTASAGFVWDIHPIFAEGLGMGISTLLQAGMAEVGMRMLVKDNPSRLLGL